MAVILDPRWKLAWCAPEESNTLKQVSIDKVTNSASHSMKSNEIVSLTSSIALLVPKRSTLFEFMQIFPLSSQVSDLDNSANISNAEEYLTTPCLQEDAGPLQFWNKNESNYLELSRLAFTSSSSSLKCTSGTIVFHRRKNNSSR